MAGNIDLSGRAGVVRGRRRRVNAGTTAGYRLISLTVVQELALFIYHRTQQLPKAVHQ